MVHNLLSGGGPTLDLVNGLGVQGTFFFFGRKAVCRGWGKVVAERQSHAWISLVASIPAISKFIQKLLNPKMTCEVIGHIA